MTPSQRKATRFYIRRYAERCLDHAETKHYSQARPYTHLGKLPEAEWSADCSGFATGCFYWADKIVPWKVDDPNGQDYVRYPSYTGTLLAHNVKRRVPLDRKFFVGDLALFGPSLSHTSHVIICIRNGDAGTAVWASHGSEAGPYRVRLHYRRDLLCVVRPESLA